MYRLTTPTHRFQFTVDPDATYSKIRITYSQNDDIILEKNKSDLTFTSATIEGETVYYASFKMTQAESKLFSANAYDKAYVQVRAGTSGGDWFASPIMEVSVYDVLNDEVLV